MNKKIPVWLLLLFIWGFCIFTVTFGWAVWHIKSHGPFFNRKTSNVIISIASFPSLVKQTFTELIQPNILVRSDCYPSINGYKVEKNYIDSNYILLSTFGVKEHQSIVKLIRIYDQKTIYQWTPNFEQIKELMKNKNEFWFTALKNNVRLLHPLLSPDGSIVFNDIASPLIKINKDSKLIWIINGAFHHSLEYDADGNIWVSSIIMPSEFLPNVLDEVEDDAIAKVSPNGKLVFQKSVAKILVENGYRGLVLGVGSVDKDLLHLNDIQPALTSSQYWMKGDLLISLRTRSTVFLYRPSTNKILWLKTGPWLHQHDIDFIDSERIGVFGNNTVIDESNERLIDGYNEEYIYDFKTNETQTPYTEFLKKAKVAALVEGRSDVLPNGDLFIEETTNNRLLRGNTKNTIWQFVNRIDKHSVAALSWSRFITKEEFKKITFLKAIKNN